MILVIINITLSQPIRYLKLVYGHSIRNYLNMKKKLPRSNTQFFFCYNKKSPNLKFPKYFIKTIKI